MAVYQNLLGLVLFLVSLSQVQAFPSQLDPTTGKKIYQLTSTPGNNYALYYHNNSWNGGYYLIYRNMANDSPSSLTYYRLDLENGSTVNVTATGSCNGASVSGNYLYCFYHDSTSSVDYVSKFDIRNPIQNPVPTGHICHLDSGWSQAGDVAVNFNASFLVFMQMQGDQRQVFKCNIATGERTLLINTTDQVEHFQFSPTNAHWYTYINQSNTGLGRVGVGRIDTEENSQLYSNDSYLNSVGNFSHPFYGKDGHLWSDAIWSAQTPQNYIVRFTLSGSAIGYIESYGSVPIDNSDWQLHFNAAHDGNWFVGDGKGYITGLGDQFISRLNINAWTGTFTRTNLANSVGTYNQHLPQANARYIDSKHWVIWNAYRTLAGQNSTNQNIFAVDFW